MRALRELRERANGTVDTVVARGASRTAVYAALSGARLPSVQMLDLIVDVVLTVAPLRKAVARHCEGSARTVDSHIDGPTFPTSEWFDQILVGLASVIGAGDEVDESVVHGAPRTERLREPLFRARAARREERTTGEEWLDNLNDHDNTAHVRALYAYGLEVQPTGVEALTSSEAHGKGDVATSAWTARSRLGEPATAGVVLFRQNPGDGKPFYSYHSASELSAD
ncbi:hypothetical protein ACIQNG_02730 [Streptomyces sp. NPDC091377]|uniref:hypothetical protein n=1 Tax=Streptomyces sp. NPDC091377 TaxID=3365995 RepID=UPI00381D5E45